MKRGTIEHPKTEMLADLLGVCVAQAVGHLEMLWHFAAKHCPRGDVGRWSDSMIAKRCGWLGDHTVFIDALLESKGAGRTGWVERTADGILVIHDWDEHADEAVRKWLANHDEKFWNGSDPFRRKSRPRAESVATESRTSRESVATGARQPEPVPEPVPEKNKKAVAQSPGSPAAAPREPDHPVEVERVVLVSGVPDDGAWLDEPAAIWRERYGGEHDRRSLHEYLAGPRAAVGHEEILRRWRNYCVDTDARYHPSAEKFARVHGDYTAARDEARRAKHAGDQARASPSRSLPAGEQTIANIHEAITLRKRARGAA